MFDQVGIGSKMISAHGNHTHGFRAARHHNLGEAGHDPLGSDGNGLKA